jgi:hypothetical protein
MTVQIKRFLIALLAWTWCFPQQLIGLILIPILYNKKNKKTRLGTATIYWTKYLIGASFGQYIYLPKCLEESEEIYKHKRHEYGHTLQSFILGPLYLFIVGAPSLLFNIISRINKNFAYNYHKRFPENWANKLGGIE